MRRLLLDCGAFEKSAAILYCDASFTNHKSAVRFLTKKRCTNFYKLLHSFLTRIVLPIDTIWKTWHYLKDHFICNYKDIHTCIVKHQQHMHTGCDNYAFWLHFVHLTGDGDMHLERLKVNLVSVICVFVMCIVYMEYTTLSILQCFYARK